MEDINLSDHFRKGDDAIKIAEKLLTQRRYTREELRGEVAITSVNRVVKKLQDLGYTIVRDKEGREATFQLVGKGPAKKRTKFPSLDDAARVVKDELVGADHVLDVLTGDGARFRGVVSGAMAPPPVGTDLIVQGVLRSDNRNDTTILLETARGKKVRLEAAQNVTN